MISEPGHLITSTLVNQRRRKTGALLKIKDLLKDILLASARGDKGNVESVGNNRQGKGDALRGRLGRVGLSSNPSILLAEQGMTREERAGVAIGTAAEEDKIKGGHLDTVLGGKLAHQILLVEISEFLGIFILNVVLVDGVDDRCAELRGDLGDELVVQQTVVAILVVERYGTLVGEEDVPLGELGGVFQGAIAGGEEGFGQNGRQGAAGDGEAEGAVSGKRGGLTAEDVASQLGG